MDVVLLTVRPPETDFRLHLARELDKLGHHVTYIHLRRRPRVTDIATGAGETWSVARLFAWFAAMRRRPRAGRPVVFNSTNLAFPKLTAALRLASARRWCLDLHDDLLYGATGLRRVRAALNLRLMVSQSDVLVHAAPALARLFPRSRHIGNGSSLVALPKTTDDPARVLILASLDDRFDFALMERAALLLPARRFEIRGRVSGNDPVVRARLDQLVAGASNIAYLGPYDDPGLPGLLADYLVAFAPYRVGTRLTDYIDPLRFYHCLASETGLVSTAIPQAVAMRGPVEVIADASELDGALVRAAARRGGEVTTWHDVAKRLVPILAAAGN